MKTVRVEIHDFWHIGSGRGQGVGVDAEVVRTSGGLPYLPGRTLKGLLRDATRSGEVLRRLPAGTTEALFGTDLVDLTDEESLSAQQEYQRFQTQPGVIRISGAYLGSTPAERRQWEAWSSSGQGTSDLARHFYRKLSTTALQEGVAKHKSLRTIEVVVPLTLHAWLQGPAERDDWVRSIQSVFPLVSGLGSGRARGFGSCTLSLEESRP